MKGRAAALGVLIGAVLAASALVGVLSDDDVGVSVRPLALGDYCHAHFGGSSRGHRMLSEPILTCSAPEHGVWTLLPVSAVKVCHEQLGRSATVVHTSRRRQECRG